VRNLLAGVIETDTGITPIVASSATEALELLKEHAVDVVVSDLFMPGVDGFQFLLQVRERFPLTKVILVSNDFGAFWVTPRRLIAEGALAVIPKSEATSTLIDLLRSVQANS
jgi:DNA-binding NarL/FixJ family response regulator